MAYGIEIQMAGALVVLKELLNFFFFLNAFCEKRNLFNPQSLRYKVLARHSFLKFKFRNVKIKED